MEDEDCKMGEEFCKEHSNVMLCLGRLEAGQEQNRKIMEKVDGNLDALISKLANGKVDAAVEKTKSNILYWVLAIAVSGVIIGLVNRWFPVVFR